MFSETPHRKLRGEDMSAALAIEQELVALVPSTLQRDRRSAKVIALRVGTTPKAVENWRQGNNLPTIPHFIALARQYPELRVKVLEWLDASTGDSGEDPSRLLNDIARFLQQRGKRT
jgi:transcriptional regulator with XRE-family HTH domain